MALKLENGRYVLGPTGLPEKVSGLNEILQNALIRLSIPKGSFPYGRELGSGLDRLGWSGEHLAEKAVALANEALLDMPGVRAKTAKFPGSGGIWFRLETPFGEGEVTYGKI